MNPITKWWNRLRRTDELASALTRIEALSDQLRSMAADNAAIIQRLSSEKDRYGGELTRVSVALEKTHRILEETQNTKSDVQDIATQIRTYQARISELTRSFDAAKAENADLVRRLESARVESQKTGKQAQFLMRFITARHKPDQAPELLPSKVKVATLTLLMMASTLFGQPFYRNFFDTNQNPIVDVTAGSNVFVSPIVVGTDTRHFRIDVPNQTNTPSGLVSNQFTTTPGLTTNGLPYLPLSGGTVTGPVLSTSPSTNGPAMNEFPVAGWVRGLFNNGIIDYSTTNTDLTATNPGSGQVMYTFATTIPTVNSRTYTAPNASDYIGSVMTTNTFTFLQGPISVNAYLAALGGSGNPSVSVHPEIYYSYDKTNWFGDWEAQNQTLIIGATNLYQWVVSFPAITSTNSAGFYLERRYKVGAAAGATHPNVVFLIGTNSASGTNDASHISFTGPSSAMGNAFLSANQTFTGSNYFTQPIAGTLSPPSIIVWSGPTNTLTLGYPWTKTTYTMTSDISVTNFLGITVGNACEAVFVLTNSVATNCAIRFPASAIGYGTLITNSTAYVMAGKKAIISVMSGSATNWAVVQQSQ